MLRDTLSDLFFRLRALFRRKSVEKDLDEELQFHFERQVEKNLARGISRSEARRQARLAFGGLDQTKEECRDARGVRFVETVLQDLGYAVRQLSKSPGFTAVAVLSLALGIGANTAIFSLVDVVLLRTLPVERPEELEAVEVTGASWARTVVPYPVFQEFRSLDIFSGALGSFLGAANLIVGERAELGTVEVVSGNYFSVLGVPPFLGRALNDDDDRVPMGHPVAVLSYPFWRDRMSADRAALGKTIRVNDRPYTVVGVAPPGFFGLVVGATPDLWVPMMEAELFVGATGNKERLFNVYPVSWVAVFGRRSPGVSREQAQAALTVAYQRSMEKAEPGLRDSALAQQIRLEPAGHGRSRVRGQFEDPLFILMALVALVLAIACANVANLLLARYAARRKEIGIRLALGAGRRRLIRQLLTESALLGIVGGLLGVLLSAWGVRLLLAYLPSSGVPLSLEVSPDARVLVFAAAVSFSTTVLFGLVPAIQSTRMDTASTIKESGVSTRLRDRFELRKGLVVLQVALSVLMLTLGSLFLQTLRNTDALDIGMNTSNVLTASVRPGIHRYGDPRIAVFYRELEERLGRVPGVRAVGFSAWTLLRPSSRAPGDETDSASNLAAEWKERTAGGDYFSAVGIPLLRGRTFNAGDAAGDRKVAIINETAARYYFPGEDPIGKAVPRFRSDGEIIGVVGDSTLGGPREKPPSVVYHPARPDTGIHYETIYLRTDADPASYAGIVRRTVADLDETLALYNVKTFAAQKEEAMARERLLAKLSGLFAGLAVLLAVVGIYGVVSYGVLSRTREIGVRMSLGAQRGDVVWMVLRNALGLVAAGLAVGLPICLWVSRFVKTLLFGVEPNDPLTLAVTVTILTAVALLAALIPARRASRVDPLMALRHE
ncbi:MAG TPA: ABC transporter permease [Bryobacterales bacterium]|nr:ABC transporter permease [Bryobacterales bacterium]